MFNTPPVDALSSLQERFAIIDLSGEIRVIDRHQIASLLSRAEKDDPTMYKKPDAELMMRRHLETLPISCNPRQVIADFWTSPNTLMYKTTAFTPKPTPPTTLNFWVGPSTNSQPGNWLILRDYLRDVICAGDRGSFDYLISYMAHMIQKPEEKPGTMIALLGGQGTGKGVYFSLLRAIWPRTTLQVADVDDVIGRFNAQLERNYIICMDEALFAGNKKALDRLKSTVTEAVVKIEQKYQPSRMIESVHRLFASSNHDHFIHVEPDDRRFVFLRVSNRKKQDTTYFGGIVAAIEDPRTIGALIYYLQRRDIASFNVRVKPTTIENIEQKIKSLEGFDRFWFEVLVTEDFSGNGATGDHGTNNWNGAVFLPTSILLNHYKEFNKNAQRHYTMQSNQVADVLRKVCPSATSARQTQKTFNGKSTKPLRGFQLPDLSKAREEFADWIGGNIEWDQPET